MTKSISIAWSDWCIIQAGSTRYLGRQFQLCTDDVDITVFTGWTGLQLCDDFEYNPDFDLCFDEVVDCISSYQLHCGVLDCTAFEDIEAHWEDIAKLFREQSMCYGEPE
jgi:hypothetical protein